MATLNSYCSSYTNEWSQGGSGWSNPSYITGSPDENKASVSVDSSSSSYLIGKEYSFSIGGHATINSISVILKSVAKVGLRMTITCYLYNDTTQVSGGKSVVLTTAPSDITLTFTPSDLPSLTNSDIVNLLNSPNFGAGICISSDVNVTGSVDALQVSVDITYSTYALVSNIGNCNCYYNKAKLNMFMCGKFIFIYGSADCDFSYLHRALNGRNIGIIGGCSICDVVTLDFVSEFLTGKKTVSIDGITVVKSSVLPKGSYITKYKYQSGSGNYYAFSLNGGGRVIGSPNTNLLLRDKLGNWVVIVYDTKKFAESKGSLDIGYISEIQQGEISDVLFKEPNYTSLLFEEVARQVYGDARLGILLRQIFVEELDTTMPVRLPDKEVLQSIPIKPENVVWRRYPSVRHYNKDGKDEE